MKQANRNIQSTFIRKKKLEHHFANRILDEVMTLPSLKLISMPKNNWKLPKHVEDTVWSRILVQFRLMNARLGNRCNSYKDYAITTQNGRVQTCPICKKYLLDEVHILITCPLLQKYRHILKILNNQTLKQLLDQYILEDRRINAVEMGLLINLLSTRVSN